MKNRRRPFVRIVKAGASVVAAAALVHCQQGEVITNPAPPDAGPDIVVGDVADTTDADLPERIGNPIPDSFEPRPNDADVGPSQVDPEPDVEAEDAEVYATMNPPGPEPDGW